MTYAIKAGALNYRHTDGNTWVYPNLAKVVAGGYARVPKQVRAYVAKWIAKNK